MYASKQPPPPPLDAPPLASPAKLRAALDDARRRLSTAGKEVEREEERERVARKRCEELLAERFALRSRLAVVHHQNAKRQKAIDTHRRQRAMEAHRAHGAVGCAPRGGYDGDGVESAAQSEPVDVVALGRQLLWRQQELRQLSAKVSAARAEVDRLRREARDGPSVCT